MLKPATGSVGFNLPPVAKFSCSGHAMRGKAHRVVIHRNGGESRWTLGGLATMGSEMSGRRFPAIRSMYHSQVQTFDTGLVE